MKKSESKIKYCPICHSKMNKNGIRNEKQRWRCTKCQKSVSDYIDKCSLTKAERKIFNVFRGIFETQYVNELNLKELLDNYYDKPVPRNFKIFKAPKYKKKISADNLYIITINKNNNKFEVVNLNKFGTNYSLKKKDNTLIIQND